MLISLSEMLWIFVCAEQRALSLITVRLSSVLTKFAANRLDIVLQINALMKLKSAFGTFIDKT